MQDRYAADIGDFGKFQLLRYLFLDTKYSLCQLWYMYPDETHNNDGMYIDYFKKVENSDEVLEEAFNKIIQSKREVKALEEANLLSNIKYYNPFLPKDKNLEQRVLWFKKALAFSLGCEIILTDSDNGIATKTSRETKEIKLQSFEELKQKNKSGKYIFLDEIEALYENSKALIVYHHLNRSFAHDEQIETILKTLKEKFGLVIAIKHKPYSPRVYFILCQEKEFYNFFKEKLTNFEIRFSHHWKLFL